jgi:Outer membrane protein beta-barrel domain
VLTNRFSDKVLHVAAWDHPGCRDQSTINPRYMHTNKLIYRAVLLALLACAAPFSNISAQTAANTFGVKGGLNWSNLLPDGEDVNEENARWGFHVGVFGRVAPSDNIGVQAELLYSTKGTTVVYDGLIDQQIDFNLAYLDLPVFLAIRLGDVLEVHAGGYAGYLLSSDVTSDGDLGSSSEELDRDNFTSIDLGLLAGVGLNLGAVQIGARYTYGLVDLADSNGAKLLLVDARNSVGQLYIAFGLGAKS